MKYGLVMALTPRTVSGGIFSIRSTYSCTRILYLLTYLHTWLWTYKTGSISEMVKDRRKLLSTAYIKSYTGFRLPPKCKTLNDLWATFKVTDSLNAAKMTKYSFVMNPTPRRVAGCIISIRPTYSCGHELTYLLTYTEQPVSFATGL